MKSQEVREMGVQKHIISPHHRTSASLMQISNQTCLEMHIYFICLPCMSHKLKVTLCQDEYVYWSSTVIVLGPQTWEFIPSNTMEVSI